MYFKTVSNRLEQKFTLAAGMLLLASGLFHVVVWLIEGGSLGGPVSWRKPILFGFSAGATVISVAWVVGKMRRRIGDFALLTGFSLAMLVEVGLITSQQWRGVASHFNRATPFDATVLAWIELLILGATVVIAELTRRSFQPLRASSDMALAIRGGMGLLLFSCLLGFVLAAYGEYQVSLGQSPGRFGAAGVMKFPHGVPMHTIQFLPLLAWLLGKLQVGERERYRAIYYALNSVLAFTVFSLLQTFSGRARFDLWWASAIFLAAACAMMCVSAYIGLSRALRFRPATGR